MSNLTPESLLEQLVTQFHELNAVNETIKGLTDEAKDAGIENVSAIKQAAKLKADMKDQDWLEKTEVIKNILGM